MNISKTIIKLQKRTVFVFKSRKNTKIDRSTDPITTTATTATMTDIILIRS